MTDTYTQALPTIHEAIRNVVGGLSDVQKDGWNSGQSFAFRSIEGTVAAVRPLLLEQEITFIPSFQTLEQVDYTKTDGKVTHRSIVKGIFTLLGPLGDSVVTETIGEAVDFEGRATNKATSAATKLFLLRMFQIGGGDEGDAENHAPTARAVVPSLTAPRPPNQGVPGQPPLAARVANAAGRVPTAPVPQPAQGGVEMASQKQLGMIWGKQNALGWSKEDTLSYGEQLFGRPFASDREFSKDEASTMISNMIELEQQPVSVGAPEATEYPEGYEPF